MNPEDIGKATEILDRACETAGQDKLPEQVIASYIKIFQKYTIHQFAQAVGDWLTSESGKYKISPSAIMDQIREPELTPDYLVSIAHAPSDITGYLARKLIGSFDLENNPRLAMEKAKQIVNTGLLGRELDRVKNQGLTSRELERLPEFGIDPKTVPTTHRLEG